MVDWDPFGTPEEENTPATLATKTEKDEETSDAKKGGEIEEVKPVRLRKENVDWLIEAIHKRMREVRPWDKMPMTDPDLLWCTPTCTIADWRHVDMRCEVGNGMVYFVNNRPNENNSIQDTLGHAMQDAILGLHARPDIRVAVFTGEGRMYCSGGDPKGWQAQAAAARGGEYTGDGTPGVRIPHAEQTPDVSHHIGELGLRALKAGAFPDGQVDHGRITVTKQMNCFSKAPQFTISLVNGSAMGGGVGWVCACDYVIAVRRAYLVLSEVKIGVIPATISPYVIAKIGTSNAKRFFCEAENISATKALDYGMVNEVVENMKEGHERVREICKMISKCGPRAVLKAKQLCVGCSGQPLGPALQHFCTLVQGDTANSDQGKDGAAAVAGGKEAEWGEIGYDVWPTVGETLGGIGKKKKGAQAE